MRSSVSEQIDNAIIICILCICLQFKVFLLLSRKQLKMPPYYDFIVQNQTNFSLARTSFRRPAFSIHHTSSLYNPLNLQKPFLHIKRVSRRCVDWNLIILYGYLRTTWSWWEVNILSERNRSGTSLTPVRRLIKNCPPVFFTILSSPHLRGKHVQN